METRNREGHDFESCRRLAATDNGLQPLRAARRKHKPHALKRGSIFQLNGTTEVVPLPIEEAHSLASFDAMIDARNSDENHRCAG